MEERKLSDEEIVKALECLAGHKACDLCKYDDLAMQDGERTCVNIVAEEAIDLIHRLQAENERLTEIAGDENLRGIIAQNCILNEENAELQKQVDELKEQAVKDTAKEIFTKLYRESWRK